MGINSERPKRAHSAPLVASSDTPRLVILAGLETPSGEPVMALASGTARRPVLTALATFAALAAQRAEGGAA